MKRNLILGGGVFVTVGVGLALARPGGPRPPEPPQGPPPGPGRRIVAALDLDRNGVVSAGELEVSAASLLALDANGDGRLTPDELGAGRLCRGPRHPNGSDENEEVDGDHPHPLGLMRLDTDGDGLVSLNEFLAPPVEHFQEIDANSDGTIDPDEALAAFPPPPCLPRPMGRHERGGPR